MTAKTTRETPPQATHWSTRTMAAAAGISEASVRHVWLANGLKPLLLKTFKVSNDKCFAEKFWDIVGLYLNPPEPALALCCDEKSQIQALDRAQPGLPLKKGCAQTPTHDYKRNGTTTLFAALNTPDGALIGQCQPRHRHQEWLKFLRQIERETPSELDLHLIADNYATHKHPKVKSWLKRHARFHMHFTPASASWLNMVERFFRDLGQNAIERGVLPNVPELISTIQAHVEHHNRNPKPFIWTARASDILAQGHKSARTAHISCNLFDALHPAAGRTQARRAIVADQSLRTFLRDPEREAELLQVALTRPEERARFENAMPPNADKVDLRDYLP